MHSGGMAAARDAGHDLLDSFQSHLLALQKPVILFSFSNEVCMCGQCGFMYVVCRGESPLNSSPTKRKMRYNSPASFRRLSRCLLFISLGYCMLSSSNFSVLKRYLCCLFQQNECKSIESPARLAAWCVVDSILKFLQVAEVLCLLFLFLCW
jgi:hypothetical protein